MDGCQNCMESCMEELMMPNDFFGLKNIVQIKKPVCGLRQLLLNQLLSHAILCNNHTKPFYPSHQNSKNKRTTDNRQTSSGSTPL